MVDVIIAMLGRRDTARGVLDAAQCLAGLSGKASVIALAADTPAPSSPFMAEALMAEVGDVDAAHARDLARLAALKTTFDTWAGDVRDSGIAVQWDEVPGPVNQAIEQRGRRADVIVIARPMDDDDATTRHGFQAALFRTERPILVVPPGPSAPFGRRVAVAWRDDGRTVKTLLPALRFLSGAEQFHLLAGVREATPRPSVPAGTHGPRDQCRAAHPANRRRRFWPNATREGARTWRRHVGDGRLCAQSVAGNGVRRGDEIRARPCRRAGADAALTQFANRPTGSLANGELANGEPCQRGTLKVSVARSRLRRRWGWGSPKTARPG